MEASGKPKQREETSAPFAFSDDEGKKAAEKAMSLLLHKDRTRWELTERLARAGFSEKASLEAIGYADQGNSGYAPNLHGIIPQSPAIQ